MPRSLNKPIALICGSRNLTNIPFDRYIDYTALGCIVSGGACGVDWEAKRWAKHYNIEYVEYKPNYKVYSNKAPLIRDREMVEFCDVVYAFWDGQSSGTAYTIDYARKLGRDVFIFIIENR